MNCSTEDELQFLSVIILALYIKGGKVKQATWIKGARIKEFYVPEVFYVFKQWRSRHFQPNVQEYFIRKL